MQLTSVRITNIANLQTVTQASVRRTTVHNRTHYGLSFCREGRILYAKDGKEYVSDPNHAILHPAGATYELRVDRPGQFPLINFDCTGLEGCGFIVIPLRNPDPYLRLFAQMQQVALFRQDDLKLLSMCYEILSALAQEQPSTALPLSGILAYMEGHLDDPSLSNEQLAVQSGFSEVYFRRLFTKAYGIPPRQYLLNLRLKKAKQLLTGSSLSVTEISEQCGFTSVYHFSRSFSHRVGMSPSAYARHYSPHKI